MAANGILAKSSLNDGLVKVFMPSAGSALAEVLTLNGLRISSRMLNEQGWFSVPVSSANNSVLLVRIHNTRK